MTAGFTPISMNRYIELHLKSNHDTSRQEIGAALMSALRDFKAGARCRCGKPIWVIGSAVAGRACFTCITGKAVPDSDYEIDEALEDVHGVDRPHATGPEKEPQP